MQSTSATLPKKKNRVVFLENDDFCVIKSSQRDRQKAFDEEKIFEADINFFQTIVRKCKNDKTRRIVFKTKKLSDDLKNYKELTDFRYYTPDEIVEVVLCLFTKMSLSKTKNKIKRFYFKYNNHIVSVVSNQVVTKSLHMVPVSEKDFLPSGSKILLLQNLKASVKKNQKK